MKHTSTAMLAAVTMLAVTLSTTPAVAAPNLIEDGTFPKPAQTGLNYKRIDRGNASLLEGWSLTHGNVDVYSSQLASTSTRHQAVDLNGSEPGAINQNFNTNEDTWVKITWKHARNTHRHCTRSPEQTYDVSVYGTNARGRRTPIGRAGDWNTAEPLIFKAQDYTYTLEFASTNRGHCGAMISDVRAVESSDKPRD